MSDQSKILMPHGEFAHLIFSLIVELECELGHAQTDRTTALAIQDYEATAHARGREEALELALTKIRCYFNISSKTL